MQQQVETQALGPPGEQPDPEPGPENRPPQQSGRSPKQVQPVPQQGLGAPRPQAIGALAERIRANVE